MQDPSLHQDTPAWIFFVHVAFVVATGLMVLGICVLPADLWIKGYFLMGLFFTIASTFTLAKTIRDNHENRKLVNRLKEVKTEKLLHEFELKN
jgi:hypothetical protein